MPLFQRVLVPKSLLFENEFDLPENEPVGRMHFHMNGIT